ncbi:MAG TPA: serine/threonine-protein kinase, partial [Terriglobales bacterium]|nr:serine/threonine-protein kinase [Terriglobales bacterium]
MIGELISHYRIVSKIGQGGMGVVYRARDEVLQRDVALKVVAEGALREKLSREHLLHEARAASALSHPNICTIHEVGEFKDELYMVMELVEGKSLRELIGSDGLAPETAVRHGVQIAAALAHAHSRNVVHHDLKSANILVTPEGLVKVLDFGLARRLPELAGDAETISLSPVETAGMVMGTLFYMAPEVLRGQPGDQRSDLWALGTVLYEATSGQLPFRGTTGVAVGSAILHEPPLPLPERIPPGLRTIIQR